MAKKVRVRVDFTFSQGNIVFRPFYIYPVDIALRIAAIKNASVLAKFFTPKWKCSRI
jgi:hypothetical protein